VRFYEHFKRTPAREALTHQREETPKREDRGEFVDAAPFVLGRRELLVCVLLFLFAAIVYNANLRSISAGDTYPARYLPFAIWHYHTLHLDPIEPVVAQGRGDKAFWIVHGPDGRVVSLYPVVAPTLLSPLYLPAVVYLNTRGWTDARLDYVARVMEKLTASLVAAISVALLYLLLRRRTSERIAVLLALAFAFGTTTWVISSQALWQHGMAQLLLIGSLLVLTSRCTRARAVAAGLLLGLLAANRPPDALIAATLGVYGLFWARRQAFLLAAGVALPVALVLLYNLNMTGNVAGGYGLRGTSAFLQHDLFYGIAGILFSPMRGLFVYSPFLLFIFLIGPRLWRDRSERGLTFAMLAAVILQLILYAKADWRSGLSWGPRYMTDLLPMLIWLLVPVVASLRTFGRVCFMAAVLAAVMIEGVGAFWYEDEVDRPLYAIAEGPGAMRPAWNWRNASFIRSLRRPHQPFELFTQVQGNFDGIQIGGNDVTATNVGDQVDAVGWALSGATSPAQVAITIDGEERLVFSRSFFDRADIRTPPQEAIRVGWRVPINLAGLAPGEHRLTAFAWISNRGERRFIGERTLTVNPSAAVATVRADLETSAKAAAQKLLNHQEGAGCWLTAYTDVPHFEGPKPELNTFLNAFLVDLLAPMESTGRFGNSLLRARDYLTAQIEPSGLVRYHGLPNAPGIGTLGCVITPDADDTALVWRLAPRDPQLRSAALSTLKQYRSDDGLYRTWLAPKDAYQCIDPGHDPDPTDLTIQMHVLLFLAQAEPPAAESLCKAMQPAINEDRVWVYYSMTPLVPLVRLKDLQAAGCALELPESRTRSSVPDQAPWVKVASLLGGAGPNDGSTAEIETALRDLARDDFALVRRNPPLLYHNDLTASVRRYYWSEDAGYALWLRLYFEYERVLASRVRR